MTPTQANRVATIRVSLASRKAIAHCGDSPGAVKLALVDALRQFGEVLRDAPVGRRTADLWLPGPGIAVWVATGELTAAKAWDLADALACRRPAEPAAGGVVFVVPASLPRFLPTGARWPLPVSVVNQPRQEGLAWTEESASCA